MSPLHLIPRQSAQRRPNPLQSTLKRTRHTQGRGRVNYPDPPNRIIQLLDLIPALEEIGHRLSLIPQVGVLRMMSGRGSSPSLWREYGKVGPARVSVGLYCCITLSSIMQTFQFQLHSHLASMRYVELHANRTILNPKQYSYPHLLIQVQSLHLVMLSMSMSVPRMS
jgi:hypothetical protein